MRSRFLILWAVTAFAAAVLIFAPATHTSYASPSGVVISAVYGGGGNDGSTYTHDYIELFNAGSVAVDLTGWSVQYADTHAGASWEKTFLNFDPPGDGPDNVLQPGQYLLTMHDMGNDREAPPADIVGTSSIDSDGNVRVALMRTMDTISGESPYTDANTMDDIEDFFGGGDSTVFEGAAAVVPGGWDDTMAWVRDADGCQDTDNNNNDFSAEVAYPNARSLSTPLDPCEGGVTGATGSIVSTETIASGQNVTVTVTDADLAGDGTVSVDAAGSSGDDETLTLNETGTPGEFTGTFTVHNSAPTDGNSMLEEQNGTITFTYTDALDAEGDVDTDLTDVTTVNDPTTTGSTGSIDSTASIMSGGQVTVTVMDADLTGATVDVSAVASNGDTETLTLNGTAGTYTGNFIVANAPANSGNGSLELSDGTITFTYIDALDAEGDLNTALSDTTTVSVPPPGGFELVSPENGDIIRAPVTTFTWTEASGASTYTVFLANLSSNTRIGESYEVTVNAGDVCVAAVCSIPSTDLVAELEHGTYSWTAIASGDADAEANNGPNVFTVSIATGLELVVNGGFEDGSNAWTLTPRAKVKCNDKGAGSLCALKMNRESAAKQKKMMDDVLAFTDTSAGDVIQVSAQVNSSRADQRSVVVVAVKYENTSTAGNGKEKFRLDIAEATTGFKLFSQSFVLADAIVNGNVQVKYDVAGGKQWVDDVSVMLMPIGTTPPRGEAPNAAPQPDGVLPPPAAPDGFRGNN